MNFIVNSNTMRIVSSSENTRHREKKPAPDSPPTDTMPRRLIKDVSYQADLRARNREKRFRLTGFVKLKKPATIREFKTIYTVVYDSKEDVYYVGYDAGRLLQKDVPNEMLEYSTLSAIKAVYFPVKGDQCGC